MSKTNNIEATEAMAVVNTAEVAAPSAISGLENPSTSFYCSIPNDGSRESAVKIYNAVNSKGNSLDDAKGSALEIVDVAAHAVQMVDENTGELVDCTRVVLIDKDGHHFDAVSKGIVSSLQKIFGIVGTPTYNPPLKMRVVEQKTRKGYRVNTLELV